MKSRTIGVGIFLLVLSCQAPPQGPQYRLPPDLKQTDVAWLREQLGAHVERVDGMVPLRDTLDVEGEDEAVALAPGRVTLELRVASRGGEAEEQGVEPLVFEAEPSKIYLLGRSRAAGQPGAYRVIDMDTGDVLTEIDRTEREVAVPVAPAAAPTFEPAVLSAAQFRWSPLHTIYLRILAVDGVAGDHREVRQVKLTPGRHEVEILFRLVGSGEDEDGESATVETRRVLVLDVEEGGRYRVRGQVKEGAPRVWILDRTTKEIVAGDML